MPLFVFVGSFCFFTQKAPKITKKEGFGPANQSGLNAMFSSAVTLRLSTEGNKGNEETARLRPIGASILDVATEW